MYLLFKATAAISSYLNRIVCYLLSSLVIMPIYVWWCIQDYERCGSLSTLKLINVISSRSNPVMESCIYITWYECILIVSYYNL